MNVGSPLSKAAFLISFTEKELLAHGNTQCRTVAN
jgi:hypothetical protein